MTRTQKWLRRQLIEARAELMRIRGVKRGGYDPLTPTPYRHDADPYTRDRMRASLRKRVATLLRLIPLEDAFEARMEDARRCLPPDFCERDRQDEFWETFGKPRL